MRGGQCLGRAVVVDGCGSWFAWVRIPLSIATCDEASICEAGVVTASSTGEQGDNSSRGGVDVAIPFSSLPVLVGANFGTIGDEGSVMDG